MNRALELRSEDHIHENDREQEGPQKLNKRFFQLPPAAGDSGRISRQEVHRSNGLTQGLKPVSQGKARRYAGAHRGLSLTIESIDARRTEVLLDINQAVQAYQSAARRWHIKPRDRRGILTIL